MKLIDSQDDLHNQIAALLAKANLSTKIIAIEALANGGNNRSYRVETHEGIFAAKKYFRQADDVRNRLAAEFSFLLYAAKVIPERVPKPYSCDEENGIALYEFIHGTPFTREAITWQDVQEASDFFCALNQPHARVLGQPLKTASEACFSLLEHLALISERINKLQQISQTLSEDSSAKSFIQALKQIWQSLSRTIQMKSERSGIAFDAALDQDSRCLSPSDFGFHNVLKEANGRFKFLDFEYAGWDDPAKMVGDFFAQLAHPIYPKYFDAFVARVMQPFPVANQLIERARLLRPVYQVKWCCIALNVFIPVHLKRRQFANPNLDVVQLKKAQLTKAEFLLHQLEEEHYG